MLKVKEIVKMQIEKEINRIKTAMAEGNIGKGRVCARRGAGLAIEYWLKNKGENIENASAMQYLDFVINENSLPEEIKIAAEHLTAKVNGPGSELVSENPEYDCRTLTAFFLAEKI